MLEWIFDPAPPSGAREGGIGHAHAIPSSLDTFVREVLQNALDRKRADAGRAAVDFHLRALDRESMATFLDGLRWEQLRPHLDGALDGGGVTIAGQIRSGLEATRSSDLLVLTIAESGTEGLTGEEDEEDDPPGTRNHFNLLCRHTLITSDTAHSGGTYGIGKSVLWRFSLLSTVVFASRTPEGLRLFGRCELPSHRSSGEWWQGRGFFGTRQSRGSAVRAVSIWNDDAEPAVGALGLGRPAQLGRGTSIAVVGFHEPDQEEPRPLEEIARDITLAAARWYWPAISGPGQQLDVGVTASRAGNPVYAETVGVTDEVLPFTLALDGASRSSARTARVEQRSVEIGIPARNDGSSDRRTSEATLRVLEAQAGDNTGDLRNSVALIRGHGQVVRYYRLGRTTDRDFHAVLLAGHARGTGANDSALENFLRAAEPPAHDDWVAPTERLRDEYRAGSRSRLQEFWARLDSSIVETCSDVTIAAASGPARLAELLSMERSASTARSPAFRVDDLRASADADGVWTFAGRVRRVARTRRTRWRVHVTAWLDAESGRGAPVEIESIEISRGNLLGRNGTRAIDLPGDVASVEFSGRTAPLDGPGGLQDALRTRLRVSVRPEYADA